MATPPEPNIPDLVRRVQADSAALTRKLGSSLSSGRLSGLSAYYAAESKALEKLDFDRLSREDQIDVLLLHNKLKSQISELKIDAAERAELATHLPFMDRLLALDEKLRETMSRPDGRASAVTLDALADEVSKAREKLAKAKLSPAAAIKIANAADELQKSLSHWAKFYAGYDPDFTWWCDKPVQALNAALENFERTARQEKAGLKEGDTTTIIGDPIGREALLAALEMEMIDYSPEELIKIAEKEFAWCEAEMAKAARELGCKTNAEALEKVKNLYVKPGEQPELIRDLAVEAIDYFKKNMLLTVPPLAESTWRMSMMSPEQQLQSPFFLGGELIQVSFPTSTMDHDAKLMSLRGNNPHFARATVHHELIPGHHLQFFYMQRHNTHREAFDTPFWIEGWALYWEFMLWDRGFARNAEDRVGMLFWRMHRCARIIFSLKFHLGQMTPQECIDMLVEKVGHERENATAEVRRSFFGNYPPLYQAAYMLGALQLRALRTELVDSGRMKEMAFHDAILMGNQMPIAMVRARLNGEKLQFGKRKPWRWYPGLN